MSDADVRVWVCVKWISTDDDRRDGGVSLADEAALELALRIGEHAGADVGVATLGGIAAEATLRHALALGAARAVRIDADPALDSSDVAAALAEVVRDAALVVCGAYSVDRGTGSVPAFIAAELGARQALGLVEVVPIEAVGAGAAITLRATRRLDGGRRERVVVDEPAVVSVEGAVARLRRASLPATLAARHHDVEVVSGPIADVHDETIVRPYRPRARVLAAPQGDTALDRVRALTDAGGGASAAGETVVLDPPAAAAHVLEMLRNWGYIDAGR
jgi:electron transfer flavoprotein beta subunit